MSSGPETPNATLLGNLTTANDIPPVQLTLHVQGYAIVPEGDEEALKEAVYSKGPVAVSIDAAHPGFRFYSHGKYSLILLTAFILYMHTAPNVRRAQ